MVYLDTGSLVKLYLKEYGSEDVKELVSNASAVITSIVAYAESRAAFVKQYKNGELTRSDYIKTKVIFDRDWKEIMIVWLDEEVSRLAGEFAEKYILRGFEAIHLASYVVFKKRVRFDVPFSSFDDRLKKAAEKEAS